MSSADVRGAAGTGDEALRDDMIEALHAVQCHVPDCHARYAQEEAVDAILPVVARDRARQEAALNAIRALHVRQVLAAGELRTTCCLECSLDWPCKTVRILDGEK